MAFTADSNTKTRGKLCRNHASSCAPCGNKSKTQHGNHGFCNACAGYSATLLCLNYTNPRVRCGNGVEQSGRNAAFCNTCSNRVVPSADLNTRLCKNAAAIDAPCTKPVAVHLQGPLHGACLECAKVISAIAVKDSLACRTPLCHNTFVLKHSRYCRECVLDPARNSELVLDIRDKTEVLAIESSATQQSLPKLQTIPLDGDPFFLYLPRKHMELPSYESQPHYRAWNHCRLCFETVPILQDEVWDTALERHARERHDLSLHDLRRVVLETTMHDFPTPITSQIQRTVLDRFRSVLCEENFTFFPCACCVRGFAASDLTDVVFPPEGTVTLPAWLLRYGWDQENWDALGKRWLEDISTCFSVETYLRVHFRSNDRRAFASDRVSAARKRGSSDELGCAEAFQARVVNYIDYLRQDLNEDSIQAPTGFSTRWLLHKSSSKCKASAAQQFQVTARFCRDCAKACAKLPEPDLTDSSYRRLMPDGARADGFWGGPMPSEIAALGPLAAKIIRLVHVSCSILRVKLSPEEFIRTTKAKLRIPEFVTGNAMAVPQYGEEFPQVLGVLPEELAQHVQVQFEGDLQWIKKEDSVIVSVPILKNAFRWLLTHNWHWILATANDSIDVSKDNYGPRLNALLRAYANELGGKSAGVPKSVVEVATPLDSQAAAQAQPGPAEVASENCPPSMASAALLGSGVSSTLAMQQVQKIIKEHQEIMHLDARAAQEPDQEAKLQLIQLELLSLEKVRSALEKLTSSQLREQLVQDLANHLEPQPILKTTIRCGNEYVKSYSPDFWGKTFVEAFPRGDCMEKQSPGRVHPHIGVDWTALLLDQIDKPWLRCHYEFLATTMLYFIRLDQIKATEALVNHSSKLHADAAIFHRLHAHDLTQLAAQASDAATLRSLLNDDKVAQHIRSAMCLSKGNTMPNFLRHRFCRVPETYAVPHDGTPHVGT